MPSGNAPAGQESWASTLHGVQVACDDAQDALMDSDPIVGDPTTQRAVDAWVDHTVAALRAIRDHAEEVRLRCQLTKSALIEPQTTPIDVHPGPGAHRAPDLAPGAFARRTP